MSSRDELPGGPLRIGLTTAARTRPLRREVLRPEAAASAPLHSDDAPDALHLAAFAGAPPASDPASERVVGCCVLLPRPFPGRPDAPGWQLRGMAVAPEARGRGVGSRLLQAALQLAHQHHVEVLWCEARTSAQRFYAAHGFEAVGEQYVHAESGLPHVRMWRLVSA